ncbi:hypothetical protein HanIR_Chr05g0214721 [Helianthus annuus]|nr:hypothetical protein HanIR_Chr05g0214721 [Helianthus annuus]
MSKWQIMNESAFSRVQQTLICVVSLGAMSEDGIWVMLLIPCYIEDNGNTYDVFLSFKRGSTGNEHTLGALYQLKAFQQDGCCEKKYAAKDWATTSTIFNLEPAKCSNQERRLRDFLSSRMIRLTLTEKKWKIFEDNCRTLSMKKINLRLNIKNNCC